MRGGEATQGVLTSTTYQHCLPWEQKKPSESKRDRESSQTLALYNSDYNSKSLSLPDFHVILIPVRS